MDRRFCAFFYVNTGTVTIDGAAFSVFPGESGGLLEMSCFSRDYPLNVVFFSFWMRSWRDQGPRVSSCSISLIAAER